MRINTNTAAMNTYSNLTSANASKSNSLAKLSSGLRINKAGDDAAGLAISEKMKNQISGMTQASRNAQDGISLIQTAEGALGETHSILNRMRDLTVQSANDTNTLEDRDAIQKEITSLTDEVDRIANNTKFNGKSLMNAGSKATDATVTTSGILASGADTSLLNDAFTTATGGSVGSGDDGLADSLESLSEEKLGEVVEEYNKAAVLASKDTIEVGDVKVAGAAVGTDFSFQIGANAGEKIDLTINNMTAEALGIKDINVTKNELIGDNPETTDVTETKATQSDQSLAKIDKAIKAVSAERANLGATQNRLDHTVSNLATTKENLSEANSRITDVDMAEEMMSFTKSNILSQASTSMLAQANQMPQSVLSLLQ